MNTLPGMKGNGDLAALDATAQAELVRSGEATPAELVDAAIARAEAVNPQVNAIIHELYEEGRAEAANDLPDGPFRGVPFLFKDLGAGSYAGQPHHMGMKLMKEAGFRMPVDSYLAQRARAAGLVCIGKTNTPELGILPTTEPDAYGATRNPWDLERTAGGSSGGAGAAVAAGIVPFAHASDGGGSIRIPASCNGLVGLKTTRARVSQGPITGDVYSGLSVEFAVTRSVRDAATLLDALQGPAPGDPYVAPAPERPYADELTTDPGKLRIGLITESVAYGVPLDPAVIAAAKEAAKLLESLGHEITEDVPVPPEDGPMHPIEAFVTRWCCGKAGTLEQIAGAVGRPITEADVEPLTWAMAERGREIDGGHYLATIAFHQAMTRFIAAWHEGGGDLLLSPTLGEVTPPLGTFDDSGDDPMRALERAQRMGVFTAPFNATGQPAISLPLAWSEEGLPVGIQLVAPYGREDLLIRIAAQLEQAQPWADRRPPVFAA